MIQAAPDRLRATAGVFPGLAAMLGAINTRFPSSSMPGTVSRALLSALWAVAGHMAPQVPTTR